MGSRDLRLTYTVSEAAELLGIGRSTAYELVARGELATVRLGARAMVTRPALAALLGMDPPLPGELDAIRAALARAQAPEPTVPAPARATRPSHVERVVDGQRPLFSA
ncbi:MAG: helix-turn-helix domain-containing protein [Acidimicrobiales bacterium]